MFAWDNKLFCVKIFELTFFYITFEFNFLNIIMKKLLLSVVFILTTFTGINAQVTYTNPSVTLEDANGITMYGLGGLTGTLTSIEFSATKVSGTTPANELSIYITPTAAFDPEGLLYAGGSSNDFIGALEWQPWPNVSGNNVSGTITLGTPITFTGTTLVRLASLYLEGTSATWENITVTLHGVTETNICGSAGDCDYESITNVSFAGIENPTGCNPGFTDYDLTAQVVQGNSYTLSVTIETDESDYLYTFIDWNGNGNFNDEGEMYVLAEGVDVAQAYTMEIVVPENQYVGEIAMKVFLAWDVADLEPCDAVNYGEVENYRINVQAAASVNDFFAKNISIYPNPTAGIFNLTSTTVAIQSVKLTDLNGRVVKNMNVNSLSDTEVNISDLTAGMYFVTVQTDLGIGSAKVVKK